MVIPLKLLAIVIIPVLGITGALIYILIKRNKALHQLRRELSTTQNHIKDAIEAGVQQAQETARRAIENDRQKSSFLAKMSHELRTPMNGILGFTNLLTDENLSPTIRRQYVDIINRRGQNLLQIINDIINISQIEANKLSIKTTTCNLNQLIKDLHLVFGSSSNPKKQEDVEVHVKLPLTDSNSLIVTDPVRLEQVLSNLIDNAIKFTESGYVEFGYSLDQLNKIRFYIKDTGVGIPPEEHDKIFSQFFKSNRGMNALHYGTGLGLSICKGLVELLGGSIAFESSVGQGTTFFFSIPFIPSKPSNTPFISKSSITAHKPNFKGKVILVVEDDLISYQFIEILLRNTNARLIHVKNGEDAIEVCQVMDRIDLVLMDMQLPFIDGYETTARIKALKPSIPIVAQTANAMSSDRIRSLEAGCSDFISKPIDPDEFLMVVTNQIIKQE